MPIFPSWTIASTRSSHSRNDDAQSKICRQGEEHEACREEGRVQEARAEDSREEEKAPKSVGGWAKSKKAKKAPKKAQKAKKAAKKSGLNRLVRRIVKKLTPAKKKKRR